MRMSAFPLVGFLGFAVATVALARQQAGNLDKLDKEHQHEHRQKGIASVAALRAEVAKLRAEVELLELEHEVNKNQMLEELKQQHADSAVEQADSAAVLVTMVMEAAGSTGKLDETKQQLGFEEGLQRAAQKVLKERAERRQVENDCKKKAFVKQATELHERRFLLADLEKQLSIAK
jgi:hypothetical protein